MHLEFKNESYTQLKRRRSDKSGDVASDMWPMNSKVTLECPDKAAKRDERMSDILCKWS